MLFATENFTDLSSSTVLELHDVFKVPNACATQCLRSMHIPTSDYTTDKPYVKLPYESASSASSSSGSLSQSSCGEDPCPSESDGDQEPQKLTNVTNASTEKDQVGTNKTPHFLIPEQGRLFVNVIERDGSTFLSRSSVFSRNRLQRRLGR
ncbi:hypothetical protein FRC12_024554 [Ceratobasidium sp. 428]|nr:hypothetical protein FRC12_024554 [Ceratobasidium sp. 428]